VFYVALAQSSLDRYGKVSEDAGMAAKLLKIIVGVVSFIAAFWVARYMMMRFLSG